MVKETWMRLPCVPDQICRYCTARDAAVAAGFLRLLVDTLKNYGFFRAPGSPTEIDNAPQDHLLKARQSYERKPCFRAV